MKNHYDILGINRNATPDEIKTAYRKLSVKFHPDKNDGEAFFADMFRQINEAYTTLYDVKSRKAYDSELYKFENPAPTIKKVYQQPQQPASKPTYNSTYNYQAVDKWEPVKKWRQRRNFMLLIVGILVLIVFIAPKNGQSQSDSSHITDSTSNTTTQIPKHHKHRHKVPVQENAVGNDVTQSSQSNYAPPVQEQTNSKATDTVTQTATYSNASADSIHHPPKKRRGFFGRLFGKKVRDTIQVRN